MKVHHGGEGMAMGRCGKLLDEGAKGERRERSKERLEERGEKRKWDKIINLLDVLPQQGSTI